MKNGIAQFKEFCATLTQAIPTDLPPTLYQRLIENPSFARRGIRRMLTPSIPVTIDPNVPLDCLLKRIPFRSIENISEKRFPNCSDLKKKTVVHVELVPFQLNFNANLGIENERPDTPQKIRGELRYRELACADLQTLLWTLIQYPEARELKIFALGSVNRENGKRYSPGTFFSTADGLWIGAYSTDYSSSTNWPLGKLYFLAKQLEIPQGNLIY